VSGRRRSVGLNPGQGLQARRRFGQAGAFLRAASPRLWLVAPATARVCREHGFVDVVSPATCPLPSKGEEGCRAIVRVGRHRELLRGAVCEQGQVRGAGRVPARVEALSGSRRPARPACSFLRARVTILCSSLRASRRVPRGRGQTEAGSGTGEGGKHAPPRAFPRAHARDYVFASLETRAPGEGANRSRERYWRGGTCGAPPSSTRARRRRLWY